MSNKHNYTRHKLFIECYLNTNMEGHLKMFLARSVGHWRSLKGPAVLPTNAS